MDPLSKKKIIIFFFFFFLLFFNRGNCTSLFNDVSYYKFNNGFVVLKKNYPSDIIAISLLINSGSNSEGKLSGSGVAHLTEHLVFEARKDLDEKFRQLGAIVNAYTTYDYTLYHIEVPKENCLQALNLLLSALYHPNFNQDIFLQEREVILKEIKFRDDQPLTRLSKLVFEKSYNISNYKYPVIGYNYLFLNLSLNDAIKFHNENYLPNNSYLAIVGNIDEKLITEIKKLIQDLKPKPIITQSVNERERSFPVEYQETYPGKLIYLAISFPGVSISSQDLFALDLLASYLGEGKDSLLYKKLVRKGIVEQISCYNYTPRFSGLFVIQAIVDKRKLFMAIEEIKKIISNFNKLNLNKKSLEKIKKNFKFWHLKNLESPLTLAKKLTIDEAICGNYKFEDYYLKRIEKINVKDIKRVFEKYLIWDKRTVVELLPKKKEKTLKKINQRHKIHLEKKIFPNGLKVILGENKLTPLVAITIAFNGGVRCEEKFNNGITKLTMNTLLSEKLVSKIKNLGGTISTFSGNNSFGLEIEILKDHITEALKILTQNISKPHLKKEDFLIEKRKLIASLKDLTINPFYQAEKLLRLNLFPDYPYGLMPEGNEKSIKNIKLIQALKYINYYMKPNNAVLSIIGNIEPEAIYQKLKTYLLKWKGAKINYPNFGKINEVKENLFKKRIPTRQAIIMVGFKIPGITSPQMPVIDLISQLFSGSGTKFYQEIRKKLRASYSLGSFLLKGPDTGMLVFYIATDPDKLMLANSKLKEILSSMENYLSEESLRDAKTILKTEFQKQMISNSDIGFRVTLDELLGLGYNYYEKYLPAIEKVKLKDLLLFAKKKLNIKNSITVWVGNLNGKK